MLKPSYAELMDVLNKETGNDDQVTSRYTIVIAAAKRARQIIDGDEPMVDEIKGKPLSTAVSELSNSKIKVVPEGEGTVLNLKKNEDFYFDIEEELKNKELTEDASDEDDKIEDLDESKEEFEPEQDAE